MILRVFLFMLMSVGLLGFGIFTWRSMHQAPPPPPVAVGVVRPPPPPMVGVLIAGRDLRAGGFLRLGDLSTASFGVDALPPDCWRDTLGNRTMLDGALIRRTVPHESVLQRPDLLLAGEHGFLAALLAPGMRAFTIARDQVVADAGLIWPGDRVDLILTQQMPGILPLDQQMAGETVLVGIRVLAVDQQLIRPSPATLSSQSAQGTEMPTIISITVEVSPADAERLAVALRLGKLAFAVRPSSPEAAGMSKTDGVWAGDVMHALRQVPSAPATVTLHVFDGDAGDKEYKF